MMLSENPNGAEYFTHNLCRQGGPQSQLTARLCVWGAVRCIQVLYYFIFSDI